MVSVQRQIERDLLRLDYCDSIRLVLSVQIINLESLREHQNRMVSQYQHLDSLQTERISVLLRGQVNDLGEISKLRKKKRFAGFVIKVGLPVVFIGGVYLGSKF